MDGGVLPEPQAWKTKGRTGVDRKGTTRSDGAGLPFIFKNLSRIIGLLLKKLSIAVKNSHHMVAVFNMPLNTY